jgi:large subunit ribosomal protein L19
LLIFIIIKYVGKEFISPKLKIEKYNFMVLDNNTTVAKETLASIDFIKMIESKHMKSNINNSTSVEIGDLLRIGYQIPEGDKERTQFYEGVVIAKQNRGVRKTFTLRRTVQGIGVEQIFLLHSPKIVSITKKQRAKVRQAKLYYIRELSGKATRLKRKF